MTKGLPLEAAPFVCLFIEIRSAKASCKPLQILHVLGDDPARSRKKDTAPNRERYLLVFVMVLEFETTYDALQILRELRKCLTGCGDLLHGCRLLFGDSRDVFCLAVDGV